MWVFSDAATRAALLIDNFVGVNGTLLPAHTPDVGGPWVNMAGSATDFGIEGDKASCHVASGDCNDGVNVGTAKGTLSYTFQFLDLAAPRSVNGYIGSSLDESTEFIEATFDQSGVSELQAGDASSRFASMTFHWTPDTNPHVVALTFDGHTASVRLDGVLKAVVDLSLLGPFGTYAAIEGSSATTADKVQVSNLQFVPFS